MAQIHWQEKYRNKFYGWYTVYLVRETEKEM